jgi:hypothetical protein
MSTAMTEGETNSVATTLPRHFSPEQEIGGETMASKKQRTAARNNIKKAAGAAKRKQTLKKLPKKTRRALGKQAAKARQSRR